MARTVARGLAISSAPLTRSSTTVWMGWLGRFIVQRPLGATGGLIVIVMAATAALAPWVAPYDPKETSFLAILKPPSGEFLIGTDSFGRDVFSRLLWGARTALVVGFVSSFVGCSLGAVLGVISAYFGG